MYFSALVEPLRRGEKTLENPLANLSFPSLRRRCFPPSWRELSGFRKNVTGGGDSAEEKTGGGPRASALLPRFLPALALLELLGAWCPEPLPTLSTSAAFFWWKSPESLPPFPALSRSVFPVLARSGQFSHAFRSACFAERFRRGEKLATVSAAPAHAFRVLALLGGGPDSVALSSA